MAKLRIQGDSSGYVDLEAPNAASSRTIDLDQIPLQNTTNTFTQNQLISGGDAITQEIRSSGNQAHFRMVSDLNDSSWMISNESNANRLRIMHTDTSTSTNSFPLYLYEAGYVTMPYQPAWFATGNVGWHTSSTGGVIPFAAVPLNRGNHYSTSGSKFTAPISGVYQVNFQAYMDTNSQACMKLNGGDYIPTGGDTSFMLFTNNSAGQETVSASGTIYLAQGDYIQMGARNNQSVVIYTGHSSFSGYLIG